MKNRMLLLLMPALMLASCGGSSSSSQQAATTSSEPVQSSSKTSMATATEPDSYEDPFADYSFAEISVEQEELEIQIGGQLQNAPTRIWNPEAATDDLCFEVNANDHNRYDITYDFKAGDVFLFFFYYSWDTVIGFDGVDWDFEPSIVGLDAFVTDAFEGDDILPKQQQIYILKDVTLTFSYFVFGAMLQDMTTGMALTGLSE